jgi:hypothetical protein
MRIKKFTIILASTLPNDKDVTAVIHAEGRVWPEAALNAMDSHIRKEKGDLPIEELIVEREKWATLHVFKGHQKDLV